MKIEKRKVSELIRAEYNPRKITKVEMQDLKDGIDEFSLVLPLVVNEHPDRNNVIVGGHQRLKLWEEMGHTEVDCSIVNLPLDKEKKLNVKLNKNGGSFDDELLQEFFEYEELIEWGFTPDELFDQEEKTDGLIEDDEIPEVKESKVKCGDIWQLGEHRVMCGDSTSSDDVEKLMNGEKADMVFTDPPYGIEYKSNWKNKDREKFDTLKNDNSILDFRPVLDMFCSEICPIYIWTSHQVFHIWREMYSDIYKSTIIWYKKFGGMGDLKAEYGHNYEMCLYLTKNRIEFISERPKAVWEIASDNPSKYKHPTQKPIELALKAFSHHKAKNILDLFLGSGSTLIAAEKLKRKCYGMELDEKYCDVIIERWEQFTGHKAEKING